MIPDCLFMGQCRQLINWVSKLAPTRNVSASGGGECGSGSNGGGGQHNEPTPTNGLTPSVQPTPPEAQRCPHCRRHPSPSMAASSSGGYVLLVVVITSFAWGVVWQWHAVAALEGGKGRVQPDKARGQLCHLAAWAMYLLLRNRPATQPGGHKI
jgi:hypothetical protein